MHWGCDHSDQDLRGAERGMKALAKLHVSLLHHHTGRRHARVQAEPSLRCPLSSKHLHARTASLLIRQVTSDLPSDRPRSVGLLRRPAHPQVRVRVLFNMNLFTRSSSDSRCGSLVKVILTAIEHLAVHRIRPPYFRAGILRGNLRTGAHARLSLGFKITVGCMVDSVSLDGLEQR
jgi:hypothetical protein